MTTKVKVLRVKSLLLDSCEIVELTTPLSSARQHWSANIESIIIDKK